VAIAAINELNNYAVGYTCT